MQTPIALPSGVKNLRAAGKLNNVYEMKLLLLALLPTQVIW